MPLGVSSIVARGTATLVMGIAPKRMFDIVSFSFATRNTCGGRCGSGGRLYLVQCLNPQQTPAVFVSKTSKNILMTAGRVVASPGPAAMPVCDWRPLSAPLTCASHPHEQTNQSSQNHFQLPAHDTARASLLPWTRGSSRRFHDGPKRPRPSSPSAEPIVCTVRPWSSESSLANPSKNNLGVFLKYSPIATSNTLPQAANTVFNRPMLA